MSAASIRLVLICFFCMTCTATAQASALFTVNQVQVDVTSDNALTAREEAFALAQVKAFHELVTRLAPRSAQELAVQNIDAYSVSSMIKDYEILDEKISDVRYLGTYSFRFKSDAVKQYFSGQSLNYTDIASDPVMILPFYHLNGRYDLWSYNNLWKRAWDRIGAAPSLVPTIVPVGDLQDVSDMRDDQALTYDGYRLQALVERYNAKEAVIAMATPDSQLLQSMETGAGVSGSLIIKLYRTDQYTPTHAAQFYVSAQSIGAQRYDDLFDAAVKQVQVLLRDNWKAQTMVSAGSTNQVRLRIALSTLNEWIKLEKTLQTVSAVRDIHLESISAARSVVTLSYEGTLERLQMALQRKKMQLASLQAHDVTHDNTIPFYELTH